MKTISGTNNFVVNKSHKLIFVLILIVSLCVRLPNITWGLSTFNEFGKPTGFHPDEFKVILGVKGYPKDIVIRTDFRYPTAIHYTLGILTIPLRLKKNLIPLPLDVDIYYIIGRLGMVLIGTLSVASTYQLGKKILSPAVGLLAASFLAVSLYHVRNSALVTTDVPTSLLMPIVVLLTLAIDGKTSFWHYVKLGAAVGLLVGIKYTGAFVVIPVGVIFFEKLILESSYSIRKKMLVGLTTSIFVSMLIFVITTPGIILAPVAFMESLSYELARTGRIKSDVLSRESWRHLFNAISSSTNFLFAAFSALSLLAGFQKKLKLVPYIALIVFYLLYFNTSLLPRYVITIAPFLCLICANLLVRWLLSINIYAKIAGILVIVSILGYGLFQGVGLIHIIQNDTRYQAAGFIANEIPSGSTISMGWGSADMSCGFQITKDQKRVAVGDNPDFMLLCGDGVQQLLNISSKSLDYYTLAAKYTPRYPVSVEFVSPYIFIYKKTGNP